MTKTLAILILVLTLLCVYWWLLHDVAETVSKIQIQMDQRQELLNKIGD